MALSVGALHWLYYRGPQDSLRYSTLVVSVLHCSSCSRTWTPPFVRLSSGSKSSTGTDSSPGYRTVGTGKDESFLSNTTHRVKFDGGSTEYQIGLELPDDFGIRCDYMVHDCADHSSQYNYVTFMDLERSLRCKKGGKTPKFYTTNDMSSSP